MNGSILRQILFDPQELLPEVWSKLAAGPLHTFNPGLERSADGNWILAYRVVAADGRRRIGICRLDHDFRIIPGSASPLSDTLVFQQPKTYPAVALEWFADPRLLRLKGRLFVYWNSGWHEPRNHQFLQEIDETTLHPIGNARELVLAGTERRKLEKNWMLFEHAGRALAVYSVQPHRVLECDLDGAGDIFCREIAAVEWSPQTYPACHGGLRGGAPPREADGLLWSFCHTVHDGPDGYDYRAAVYAFRSEPPFAPALSPIRPIQLWNDALPARRHPRLNPAVADVIYPCGAQRDGANWVVTWGLNDERCALSVLPQAALTAAVAAIDDRP
ncbi:MAG: hypothetical protein ACKOTF_10165 [Opitutaceae bacterium]